MYNILIVEDDVSTGKFMTIVMRRAGYASTLVGSYAEAVASVQKSTPSLVISDIMLPDQSGYKLTEYLRKTYPEIPIIIVTAKQSPSDKRYGFLVGADDYMTKPIDDQELILRIKAIFRRVGSTPEQVLDYPKIHMDMRNVYTEIDGQVIDFTQKEFLLAFKLLKTPNRILTRNDLMDDIWGNSEKNDSTLNVHINRIREKLSFTDLVEIRSLRGIGYKAVIKEEANPDEKI